MTLGLTLMSSWLSKLLTLARVWGVGGKLGHTGDGLGVGGGRNGEGDRGLGLEREVITGDWRRSHVAATGQPGHVPLTGRRGRSKSHLGRHVGHLHTRHGTGPHLGPGGVTGDHGEGLGPLWGAGVEERRPRVRYPGVELIID